METFHRTKLVAFVLAAGRWYTGGFELPVAGVILWHLVDWKLNDNKEKKKMRNVPISALAAVRARQYTDGNDGVDNASKAGTSRPRKLRVDTEDQSVGSIYSQNRFTPRGKNLRHRSRHDNDDDAQSIGSLNSRRPRTVRASRRGANHQDSDDVSVLSFTSHTKQQPSSRGNKTKKNILFSQHEEIVEFLNGKLEGAIEQHNKMKTMLEAQNQKLAEVAQAYETEKRKNLRFKETIEERDVELKNEMKKSKGFEDSQGSALHQLYDKQAELEVLQKKLARQEHSEAELQQSFKEAQQRIVELQAFAHESSGENGSMEELYKIQNERIETLQETQAELDELLTQEREKVAKYEKERNVSRKEAGSIPWDESRAPKEEIIVKKNMEIQNLEKITQHSRLRQLKAQKLWKLEKERASTIEKELSKINDLYKKEQAKVLSLETKQVNGDSAGLKFKNELSKEQQAHESSKSYLKAEKQKVLNLQKSYKEALQKLMKEQERASALQRKNESSENTILSEKGEVKSMQAKLAENEKIIVAQKSKIASLEPSISVERRSQKVKELEETLKEKQKVILKEQQRAEDKENLYNVMKSNLEVAEAKCSALEEERLSLTKTLHHERNKTSNKERALSSHESTVSSMESRLKAIENDRLETQSNLESERNRCRDLEYEIKALNDHVRTKESEVEMLERRLRDVTSTLDFTNKKLKDAEEERESLLVRHKSQLENNLEEQDRLRTTKNNDQSRILSLEKMVREKDLEIEVVRKKNNILSEDCEAMTRKINAEEETGRSLQLNHVEMKNELEDAKARVGKIEAELVNKQRELQAEQRRVENLIAEKMRVQVSLESERAKSIGLESQKKSLTSLLESEKTRVESFERLIEQKDNNMLIEHKQLEEFTRKISDLERDVAEKGSLLKYEKESVELLENSLADTESKLKVERQKTEDLESEIVNLNGTLAEKRLQQETLEATLQEKESIIASNEANKQASLAQMNSIVDEKRQELEKKLQENEAMIREEKKKIELTFEEMKSANKEKNREMQFALKEKEASIAAREKEIELALGEKESALQEMEEVIKENKIEIAVAKANIETEKKAAKEAQDQVESLTADMKWAKEESEKLEDELKVKKEKLELLEKQLLDQNQLTVTIRQQQDQMMELKRMATENVEVKKKEEEIKLIEVTLNKHKEEHLALEEEHLELQRIKEEKEADIKDLNNVLKSRDSVISEKVKRINTLESSLESEAEKIKSLLEKAYESDQQGTRREKDIRDLSTKLETKEVMLCAKEEEVKALQKRMEDEGYVHEALMQRKEESIRNLKRSVSQEKANAQKEVDKAMEKLKKHEVKVETLQQSLDDKLIMVAQFQQGIAVLEEELGETKAYYENLVAPEEKRKMGMKLREMLSTTHDLNSLSMKATTTTAAAAATTTMSMGKAEEEIINGTHSSRGVSELRNLLLATSVINNGGQ